MKHAQCFDVALMDDGSVVLASKDYRIYVYRYLMTSSSSIGGGGGGVAGSNTTPPSPLSSSSTTPNSSQMLNGDECSSPLSVNGHGEGSAVTSNEY